MLFAVHATQPKLSDCRSKSQRQAWFPPRPSMPKTRIIYQLRHRVRCFAPASETNTTQDRAIFKCYLCMTANCELERCIGGRVNLGRVHVLFIVGSPLIKIPLPHRISLCSNERDISDIANSSVDSCPRFAAEALRHHALPSQLPRGLYE
ncbi:hypothetical protein CCM_01199 [Cordyceps militaris CM01]|uniref:Uncharacterized protein n=1 Tax=Cordyceps militaris (strain CM01) TaxID=983644 RepID=G3J3R7_CORMM|nr:uncharacterized protein CCM_01199 [Cordyceps militaris CM01]EGX96542.1 hypothetical protein CCM_01199 [Cordyceps militaris CM01]